jgi:pyruvate/2-oxoglutarate dehydrogenase complex dihydrolipoamide dehydrogenase (E3) component
VSREREVDLCVIGAGTAGLTAASLGAQLGARTVLVERGEMGGECLNTGCVPSKALLAAARCASLARRSAGFGVHLGEPRIDYAKVRAHVRGAIERIAPHDSQARFEGLGVEVVREDARFSDARTVLTEGYRIRARRIFIATGSAPAVPKIEGLDDVPYLTNENVFDLEELPAHLVVIGGGPLGMELAQAFLRLGSRVTLLAREKVMEKDEPDLVAALRKSLAAEGLSIRENAETGGVERRGRAIVVQVEEAGQKSELEGTHLLIATGRAPRTGGLHLERVGVRYDEKGIAVDERLRTSARGVYALGDVVAGMPRFTHVSAYHAGLAVQNALFYLRRHVDLAAVPWVTYTDPELAHAGLTESQAREKHGERVRVGHFELQDNDRAQAENDAGGQVKVVSLDDGRVLGASILAPHAGEMIHLWVLAIGERIKLATLAQMIAPYPTFGEASKQAAARMSSGRFINERTRSVTRVLARLP